MSQFVIILYTARKLYFAKFLILCRVQNIVALGKAISGTRQSQALDKSGLCRVPGTRESQALGKICFYFFFLKNFAECHPWALGKIFFYFLKTNFAECLLGPVLGKDIFAECSPWHSAKIYFFF